MPNVVLEIDNPHFIVRLYEDLLKIEVKGSVKNEIEEALENTPIIRETIGKILGLFVPLHIRLSDIDSVNMDKMGRVKIIIPLHKDMIIPVGTEEGKKLVDKLNELIPVAKQKELERIMREHKLRRIGEEEIELGRTMVATPREESGRTMPEMIGEEEEEAEKSIEEKIGEDEDPD